MQYGTGEDLMIQCCMRMYDRACDIKISSIWMLQILWRRRLHLQSWKFCLQLKKISWRIPWHYTATTLPVFSWYMSSYQLVIIGFHSIRDESSSRIVYPGKVSIKKLSRSWSYSAGNVLALVQSVEIRIRDVNMVGIPIKGIISLMFRLLPFEMSTVSSVEYTWYRGQWEPLKTPTEYCRYPCQIEMQWIGPDIWHTENVSTGVFHVPVG